MSQNRLRKHPRVLVVDDEPHVAAVISCKFAELGYRVVSASGAAEALNILRRHRFDLAIVDYLLPGTDGVQLCNDMLSRPTLAKIPVIMLTGLPHALTEQHLSAANIRRIMSKPFSPSDLLKAAEEMIADTRLSIEDDPDASMQAAA
jgi:CheY-like chemotaxis protein